MSNPPLSFRPNDDEYIFITENNIDWSDFCHTNIARKKMELTGEIIRDKRESYRAVCNDLMIMFFGIICFGLSYVVFNLIVYIVLNLSALFAIIIGLGLLIKELQHARRFFN